MIVQVINVLIPLDGEIRLIIQHVPIMWVVVGVRTKLLFYHCETTRYHCWTFLNWIVVDVGKEVRRSRIWSFFMSKINRSLAFLTDSIFLSEIIENISGEILLYASQILLDRRYFSRSSWDMISAFAAGTYPEISWWGGGGAGECFWVIL